MANMNFLKKIKEMSKKNKVYLALLVFFALVFLVCATLLILKFVPEKNEAKKYKKEVTSKATESVELVDNPIDFDALTADNSDVIAWIQVDGTNVDYPILMGSTDADNNFYIDHDMYKKEKRAGSLYVQRVNNSDFCDFNTIIYGHNMLNGTMMGTLKKFRNKTFFNKNRYLTVYTKGHILKYEIVSAFVYDDRLLPSAFDFSSEKGRNEFIEVIKNPNTLAKNVLADMDVTADTKLVTLSTCTAVDKPEERYLVVAKQISDTLTK